MSKGCTPRRLFLVFLRLSAARRQQFSRTCSKAEQAFEEVGGWRRKSSALTPKRGLQDFVFIYHNSQPQLMSVYQTQPLDEIASMHKDVDVNLQRKEKTKLCNSTEHNTSTLSHLRPSPMVLSRLRASALLPWDQEWKCFNGTLARR